MVTSLLNCSAQLTSSPAIWSSREDLVWLSSTVMSSSSFCSLELFSSCCKIILPSSVACKQWNMSQPLQLYERSWMQIEWILHDGSFSINNVMQIVKAVWVHPYTVWFSTITNYLHHGIIVYYNAVTSVIHQESTPGLVQNQVSESMQWSHDLSPSVPAPSAPHGWARSGFLRRLLFQCAWQAGLESEPAGPCSCPLWLPCSTSDTPHVRMHGTCSWCWMGSTVHSVPVQSSLT